MHSLLDQIIEGFAARPRVAILMSGKGSNAEVILGSRDRYPNIDFVCILSDRKASKAADLAARYGLTHLYVGGSSKTPLQREALFARISEALTNEAVEFIIYAGFMRIVPASFCRRFPGINVHPADLSILNAEGRPKYVGIHAIQDALDAGESYIASSVHVVEEQVDEGALLAVSEPLPVGELQDLKLEEIQELMKRRCDHQVYPLVLERLASGLPCPLPELCH